jgi:hypothetical protein
LATIPAKVRRALSSLAAPIARRDANVSSAAAGNIGRDCLAWGRRDSLDVVASRSRAIYSRDQRSAGDPRAGIEQGAGEVASGMSLTIGRNSRERRLRARSALDAVSWVRGGEVEIAVGQRLAPCNRIRVIVCSPLLQRPIGSATVWKRRRWTISLASISRPFATWSCCRLILIFRG